MKITRENIRIVELINRVFMQNVFLSKTLFHRRQFFSSLSDIYFLSIEGMNLLLLGHDLVKNKTLTDGEKFFNRKQSSVALKKVKANLWKTGLASVHSMFINIETKMLFLELLFKEVKVDRLSL